MKMIQVNKHPAGRISNVIFGLCQGLDGLVRVFSLGFLHSTFCLTYSKKQAEKCFKKLKQKGT